MEDLQPQLVDKLTTEILILKQQTAQNIIEIGKRLVQVKDSLDHGEWLPWLETKVDFKVTTASKFMRVAKEFSNFQTYESLNQSKIFALLDLPVEDREEFTNKPHELPSGETKTINEMTTRELQAAIKAQKEAERRAMRAESENQHLKTANKILIDKAKTAGDPIIVETPVQVFPPDYERIKQENEQLKAQQCGLTTEQLRVANQNTQQSFKRIENESETAGEIHNALMSPQLVPMQMLDQALRLYLEYFPGSVEEALMDCDRSIANITVIKQAFINMTKLKVVKK